MLISVLASGSKGNSTLIKTTEYRLLVDAGMNVKYLEDKLRENEILLSDINYIFITHTHTDHISALKTLIKKYSPVLIMTEKMCKDLEFLTNYENIIIINDDMELGSLKIETIPTSHDASDGRGYIITENESSVVLITDTGYINHKHFDKIKNKSVYIFESNHDIEMLMYGRYPKWLKKRILSDVGHLSNEAASYYLSKIIGPQTKEIILVHLSEENNSPEIAIESIKNFFASENIEFSNIRIASQTEQTEMLEI